MKKSILKSLLLSGFVWALAVSQVNAGYVIRYLYDNIAGDQVINLTTNALFLSGDVSSLPTETIGNLPDANGLYLFASVYNTGVPDTYGSWTRGYFEAPLAGAYTFWIASDDSSELWLSTDTTVANKKLAAQVSGAIGSSWTNPNQWDKFSSQKSTNTINLVKGNKYYFEVLHKEGAGGDHFEVGWTLPNGTLQRPLPGYALFPYLPADTVFAVVQQPQALNVEEGRQAVLFVSLDSSTPNATFAWQKNSIAIPGATLSSYVIDKPVVGDTGDYTVKITYPGQAVVYSDPATLTVIQDVTTPTIVSVDTKGYDTLLDVVFSEPVNPASATNLANYSFDGGATVTSATLQDDGMTVRLRTSKLDVSAPHTVTVNGVRDFASTPNVVANVSVTFGATKGTIYDRVYTGITTGSTVANLTAAATFPGSPNIITNLPAFESPPSWMDNYGQYVQGWLVPDTTGDYSFAVSVDDSAQLFLSTDDTQANKVQILNLTVWADSRDYNKTAAEQQTAPTTFHLVAGRKYYIELLMNGGGGGDSMAVAWQLGGGNIANNAEPIPGANLIPYVAPTVPLTITTQPQSQTIVVFRPVTFSFTTVGSPSYTRVQWYRNSQPIAGANGLSYTINSVVATNDGAVFYALATNLVYSAASSNAVLSVNTDNVPPTLAAAGSLDGTTVAVAFSEAVEPASATNTANYAIASTTVTGVTLNPDGKTVVLALSSKAPNIFTVTVNNVKDLAGNPMVANSTVQGISLNLTLVNINNSQDYSLAYAGDITMVAGGADIWGNADQFAFAYLQLTGDFDYRLDVKSVQNVNVAAKTGLMVRKTLDPGSRYAIWSATPQTGRNNMEFYGRIETDGVSADINAAIAPALYPNTWLRLQRVGSVFNAFYSSDGVIWIRVPTSLDTSTSTDGPLPGTVYLGIATCSHNTGATTTAVVSDFGMMPQVAVAITNQPPAAIVKAQNSPLTITVGATGDPVRYQWRKDGTDIPDANSGTFKIELLQLTDAGTYSVRVFNDTSFVISSNCVVTVSTDNLPPTLVKVEGSRSFNTVTVTFSEPMDQALAENPANYVFSGGLSVLSAVRQANLTNVVLTTSQQTSGTSYTLTINNVTDLAGNALAANTTGKFTGFVLASGAAVEEIYNNTGSTAGTIAALLAAPDFVAGTPSVSAVVNSLDIWSQGGTTINGVFVINNYYGGRFYGWLTPTVSGSYTFAIASDDGGALYLSTNDQPVDKNTATPIATVSTDGTINTAASTSQRQWTKYTNQISAPVQLQAGQKYFLDAIWENGAGGNGCSVGWTTPNNATMGVIPITYISSYVNPDVATITILQQPTNTTVLQSRPATFTIAATGTSDLGTNVTYQWQSNGVDIASATARTYTIPVTTMAYNGVTYTCKISVPTLSKVSDGAVLTVTADAVPPTVVSVSGTQGAAYVAFDELLDATTAGNPANYTVTGGSVSGAKLLGDGKTVQLTVTGVTGTSVSVTTTGVKDYALNTLPAAVTKSGPQTSLIDADVGTRNTNNLALFTDPLEPGSVTVLSQTDFNILAGGSDIWNNADGMNFLYKQITGDFDVKVQMADVPIINTWTKGGLMVRQDLEGTSREFSVLTSAPSLTNAVGVVGQNVFQTQYRDTKGSATIESPPALRPQLAAYPNNWVRLKRVGDTFYSFWGTNGVDWNAFVTNAPLTPFPATVYVGLAATSHDNGAGRTALVQFRNFGELGSVTPPTPPTMTMSHQAGTLVLGWPTAAIGFKLQSSLVVPTTTWQDVAGSEATNSVTITIGAGNQYFRLKK